MNLTLSMRTRDARYSLNVFYDGGRKEVTHFILDCACTPEEQFFRPGSYVSGAGQEFMEHRVCWQKETNERNNTHTFYIHAPLLEKELKRAHTKKPLIVVCKGCDRKYSITHNKYRELVDKIEREPVNGESRDSEKRAA